MNLLLTIIIFASLFMTMGVPQPTAQQINTVYANTPAAAAGFQEGDVLLSLNGEPTASSATIGSVATANSGTPVVAVVERAGSEVTLTVTPGRWVTPEGEVRNSGFGFGYSPILEYQPVGPVEAVVGGTAYTWDLLGQMFRGLASLPGAIAGMFSATPPAESPLGPVGIARVTGEVIQQENGFMAFWNLTAVLSLNLFLLNLLPIPALDGSHIVFALLEWVRGGRKVPPEREAIVHAIGFAALMGLMLLITVNDVMRAFSGTPILGQ
jgi:regulator of sigma E protease